MAFNTVSVEMNSIFVFFIPASSAYTFSKALKCPVILDSSFRTPCRFPQQSLLALPSKNQDPNVSEHLRCCHPPGPCHPLPELSRIPPPHDYLAPWTLFTRQLPEGSVLNASQVMPRHCFKPSTGFPLHMEKRQGYLTGLQAFMWALVPAFHIAPLGSSAPPSLRCSCRSSVDRQSLLFFKLSRYAPVLEPFHFQSGVLLPWYLTSLPPSRSCLNITFLVRTSFPPYPIFHCTPIPLSCFIFDLRKSYHDLNYFLYLFVHCLLLFELECGFPRAGVFCSLSYSKVLQWCLILSMCSVNIC